MNHSFDPGRLVRRSVVPLVLAAAAIAPLASAQTAVVGPGTHGQRHGLTEKRLQAIGATADQRAKILAIQNQARVDLRAQRQANGNARQKMLAQIDAASQRKLQAQLMIAAVLTPDQRQQLLTMKDRADQRIPSAVQS
jgi:Spy/CpxP family protein refolding chaperone